MFSLWLDIGFKAMFLCCFMIHRCQFFYNFVSFFDHLKENKYAFPIKGVIGRKYESVHEGRA